MKKAAIILNRIGKVFSVINFVVSAGLVAIGILCFVSPETIDKIIIESGEQLPTGLTITGLGVAAIFLAVYTVVLEAITFCLAGKCNARLINGGKVKGLLVAVLVLGIFTNLFYLLGGIFGLVSLVPDAPNNPNANDGQNAEEK